MIVLFGQIICEAVNEKISVTLYSFSPGLSSPFSNHYCKLNALRVVVKEASDVKEGHAMYNM